jgi:hypothetical protein
MIKKFLKQRNKMEDEIISEARNLYNVYRESFGLGINMPPWEDLTENNRERWIEIAISSRKTLYKDPSPHYLLKEVMFPKLEKAKELAFSEKNHPREVAIAVTKLEECIMWLWKASYPGLW